MSASPPGLPGPPAGHGPLTPDEIDQARRLCDAVLEGPWDARDLTAPTFRAIAAARTLLPRALDEVCRLRDEYRDLDGYAAEQEDEVCRLRALLQKHGIDPDGGAGPPPG